MLTQTEAYNKYEKLRVFELERLVKVRLIDGPQIQAQIQAQIDEMREILNTLKRPYAKAISLVEMATMKHFNIPTYVLRWLASEEFYGYIGVALRIVKYHGDRPVPSSILKDIAENNPQQRTREMARNVLEKRSNLPSFFSYEDT